MKPALGLDVGGVILDFVPYRDTELSFFSNNYLNTPVVTDSIESIARLHQAQFADRVFLVSKTPDGKRDRVLAWLRHQNFFNRTGIPEENLHVCLERHEKEKIVRELGITHFVDDRAEVLEHMIGTVSHLYLFQELAKEPNEWKRVRAQVTFVSNWKELLPILVA